jgi:hypothetical protein
MQIGRPAAGCGCALCADARQKSELLSRQDFADICSAAR